jgi:hypothetical protein
MATNKVTRRDNGAKALFRRLEGTGEVTVGIHEAKGAEPKKGEDGDDDSGMSLIDVAIIHEFGAPSVGIPERSFIRAWADESKARHDDEMAKMAKLVVEGKMTLETALQRIGLRRQAEVQKRIRDRIPPPLKDATIEKKTVNGKRGDVPLTGTGQLRSGISHEVKVTK